MIAYLLKTIICSALLLVIYFLFLEKEKMHRFIRFYLLASIIISFTAPLITVTTSIPSSNILIEQQNPIISYIESSKQYLTTVEPNPEFIANVEPTTENATITKAENVKQTNTARSVFPNILIVLYVSVSLFLLLRFAISLIKITRKISRNSSVTYNKAQLILTNEKLIPHSFFRYIFIDKNDYQNNEIETEILNHELVHITQRHSLDIIFVELLLIVAWINPFLLLYKMAIKLNHEFLADQGVVSKTTDAKKYQLLLLNKANLVSNLPLTSPFNYLITKKRLIMITKKTTLRVAILKQMATIPLMLIALLAFSTKVTAQKAKIDEPKSEQVKQITTGVSQELMNEFKAITDKYRNSDNWKHKNADNISDVDLIKLFDIYSAMSKEQQDVQEVAMHAPLKKITPKVPTQKQLESFKDTKIYGLWIDDKRVKNEVLNDYKYTDFSHFSQSGLCNNAKKGVTYKYQVDLMTNAYFQKFAKETKIDKLPNIGFRTDKNKVVPKNVKHQINKESATGVSQELMDEFHAIVAKYKSEDLHWNKKMHENITEDELNKLFTIYKKMNKTQKDAQVISLLPPLEPIRSKVPSVEDFEKWKNAKVFAVWINNERVENSVLNKYKNTDFATSGASALTRNAQKHAGYVFEVGLKTHDYYKKYLAECKTNPLYTKPCIMFQINSGDKSYINDNKLQKEYDKIITSLNISDEQLKEELPRKITVDQLNELASVYYLMSDEQKSKQKVCLLPTYNNLRKKTPTALQLKEWLKKDIYGVWIDEKRVDNNTLAKLMESDFSFVFITKLDEGSSDFEKYKTKIDLMTNEFFKNIIKENEVRDEKIHYRFAFNK